MDIKKELKGPLSTNIGKAIVDNVVNAEVVQDMRAKIKIPGGPDIEIETDDEKETKYVVAGGVALAALYVVYKIFKR